MICRVLNILVSDMFCDLVFIWLMFICNCGVLVWKLVSMFVSLGVCMVLFMIWFCVCVSVLGFRFVWFLICSLKLFIEFRFGIGGGGKMLMKLFGIWLNLFMSLFWMVKVDSDGFLCLLKGLSMVNISVVFGWFIGLLIDRFGKVIMFLMFGLVSVILVIFLMIVLV